MKSLLFAVALAPLAFASARADYLLSPEDTKWFHDQANTVVQEARIAPGETAGSGERPGDKNTTPYVFYVPDGPRAYGAFFPRDSNMDLGADFISEKDVEGYIRLMAATVLQTPWQVRPGIKVPAWTLPDHVYLNGKANYWPGPQTGNDMGGGSFQSQPPLDDTYFFLFTVAEQARMAGNVDFLWKKMAIAGGELRLADLVLEVYYSSPVDPATGLVQTGDIDTPDCAHDFGFCDGVAKSGKLLFTSVLRYDAAQRLAPLFRKIGHADIADHMLADAAKIKKNIGPTFYHDSGIPGEGWLHSATNFSDQPDVWGSAYAVEIGAVDKATGDKVARSLLRGYKDHSLVKNGWVTQVLMNDPKFPKGWQRSTCAFGDYQNGGFWGTGTGWYILALNTIDPAAAKAMTNDFVKDLRANLQPSGTTQAWEVINGFGTQFQHAGYLATVAFPYAQLTEAGLLDSSGLKPH